MAEQADRTLALQDAEHHLYEMRAHWAKTLELLPKDVWRRGPQRLDPNRSIDAWLRYLGRVRDAT